MQQEKKTNTLLIRRALDYKGVLEATRQRTLRSMAQPDVLPLSRAAYPGPNQIRVETYHDEFTNHIEDATDEGWMETDKRLGVALGAWRVPGMRPFIKMNVPRTPTKKVMLSLLRTLKKHPGVLRVSMAIDGSATPVSNVTGLMDFAAVLAAWSFRLEVRMSGYPDLGYFGYPLDWPEVMERSAPGVTHLLLEAPGYVLVKMLDGCTRRNPLRLMSLSLRSTCPVSRLPPGGPKTVRAVEGPRGMTELDELTLSADLGSVLKSVTEPLRKLTLLGDGAVNSPMLKVPSQCIDSDTEIWADRPFVLPVQKRRIESLGYTGLLPVPPEAQWRTRWLKMSYAVPVHCDAVILETSSQHPCWSLQGAVGLRVVHIMLRRNQERNALAVAAMQHYPDAPAIRFECRGDDEVLFPHDRLPKTLQDVIDLGSALGVEAGSAGTSFLETADAVRQGFEARGMGSILDLQARVLRQLMCDSLPVVLRMQDLA